MRTCVALVGALTLCLAGATSAFAAKVGTPDAIYFDGKVVSADSKASVYQAFAVRGEHFAAVGSDQQVLALAGKATRRVDLQGATVIPGLADSHDHFWNTGKYLVRGVDMIGVNSLAELQQRLRTALGNARPGEVVFTTLGWSIQPALTREQLDAVSADVPIVAIASRRGTGVLNSAALRRLGISKVNPQFMGVNVPVDASGEPLGTPPRYPTGVAMIDALLPPLSTAQQDELVRQAMAERNALGITSVRELAAWPDEVAALQRLRREQRLTVRMALGIEFPDQSRTAEHLAQLGAPKRDNHWLFLDSVSEEPWAPGTVPTAQFTQLVSAEAQLGWRPAPHVGSDLARGISADDAAEDTLTAYEAVDRDAPLRGKRWYLEHVPLSTPQQMERMARLGLVISTQDAGYRPTGGAAPLPAERMAHQNPIRGFLDHQLIVIGGSDYSGPTPADREPNNPLVPFYFYVTRRMQNGAITTPAELINRNEALRIFTANAAYATFEEQVKGQIAPGMLADFVILNQDLMTVPDEQILATHPVATFVGGRQVYAAADSPH